VNVGVVSADCLEFKIRRAQARPFQVKQRDQAALVPQHIGEVGIAADNCPG